jgi:hypothetical protein
MVFQNKLTQLLSKNRDRLDLAVYLAYVLRCQFGLAHRLLNELGRDMVLRLKSNLNVPLSTGFH